MPRSPPRCETTPGMKPSPSDHRAAGRPLRLPVQAPFHLEATVRVLQRRPANLIDRWEDGCYRRTIRAGDHPLLVEVANLGSIESPDVRLAVLGAEVSAAQKAQAARIIREVLGVDLDPAGPQRRAGAEPALRATTRALRGMRPPSYPDLFETFANVIPFQQVSLEAGMAVVARLIRQFGDTLTVDGQHHRLFPSAERIATTRLTSLRDSGMSARKSQALRAVAAEIASGGLTPAELADLPSSLAMERLMGLPGIGPWSAALVLLRGFRRLDVFPLADTGAEGGLTRLLRLRSKTALTPVIERFGPFKGYLYFYSLASRLLQAGLIHPAPTRPSGAKPSRGEALGHGSGGR